jgi:RHH-type transcriptional regulator, rel operon repressor / antitoxin RelB
MKTGAAMTKTMISARVDVDLNNELEALAAATQRSKAFLINEALESYIDRQRWMEERIEASIKESDESGEFISNEAMMKWLDSWGTEDELPPPEPDIFRKPRSKA